MCVERGDDVPTSISNAYDRGLTDRIVVEILEVLHVYDDGAVLATKAGGNVAVL